MIELQGDMEGPSAAVIGIGLNLEIDAEARRQIDQAVLGINQLAGQPLNPNLVLGHCLAALAEHLVIFAEQGFACFQPQWAAYHAFHQHTVDLHLVNGQVLPGKVVDIAEEGSLLVETATGLQRFNAGEISVRSAH